MRFRKKTLSSPAEQEALCVSCEGKGDPGRREVKDINRYALSSPLCVSNHLGSLPLALLATLGPLGRE